MKIVKNIHNNISICIDSKGNEVVAFGKGIGFKKPPYEVPIQQIERTFYDINPVFIDRLSQIPEAIIEVSAKIIDYANELLNGEYNANIIFTLADHIMFSIKRVKENIQVDLPNLNDVQYIYPKEIKIGEFAINEIERQLHVRLPKQEIAVITLHVINYGLAGTQLSNAQGKNRIEQCCEIIERNMGVKINRDGFSYYRFLSHMYSLLERISNGEELHTKNNQLYELLMSEYPQAYNCSQKIAETLDIKLSEEEFVYLILHINRLISSEENMN